MLREELHPLGVEIVTVCLEVGGAEVARPFIEAARPEHPSLIDVAHRLDALFGVVNIPNGIWIDEDGVIVRPAEPAWPGPPPLERPALNLPTAVQERLARERPQINPGHNRERYPDALRDWARLGAESRYALTPAEAVAASQPRPVEVSQAAAHFELAEHLWQRGLREGALTHFREAGRLQPDNWTYKRQAWSLVSRETTEGTAGRFVQMPLPGCEADWPFETDFWTDVGRLEGAEYYPTTLE